MCKLQVSFFLYIFGVELGKVAYITFLRDNDNAEAHCKEENLGHQICLHYFNFPIMLTVAGDFRSENPAGSLELLFSVYLFIDGFSQYFCVSLEL